MATGYTAGILDGSIKNFKQFATTCMRAFGATIHMRDEKLTSVYKPRIPDSHYAERIEEVKKELENAKNISDAKIIKSIKKNLLDDQKRYKKYIAEALEKKERLDAILADVNKWTPPSEEHKAFKNFMRQQLVDTISYDGDASSYESELNNVQIELLKILDESQHIEIAANYRKELIKEAEANIEYYTKHVIDETNSCNKSNKWVTDVIQSI